MLANFQRVIPLILSTEGGYVDDPHDPGGATNLGVTIGTAKALGLDIDHDGDVDKVDIKLLKPADAAKVYQHFYWDAVEGDLLPSGLDYAVFDFAINSGVRRASEFLQRIIGAKPDGHIGPNTLGLVPAANVGAVIERLSADRLAYLKRLPNWSRYGGGWGKRVEAVRKTSLSLAGA